MAEGGIPSEDNTTHPATEGEVKPPKNVKVGLFFRPHEIEDDSERVTAKKELKDFFTHTFSPGKKNIFLSENSGSDQKSQIFRADCEDGFKRYRSFRAGLTLAMIKAQSRREGRPLPEDFNLDGNIDEAVTKMEKSIFENIGRHPSPQTPYIWLEAQVLDELNQEGYDILQVDEEGVDEKGIFDKFVERRKGELNFDEYKEVMSGMASLQTKRDGKIVSKIVSLVEKAEQQPDEDTNIAGVFGRGHEIIVDSLPERIKAVTDSSHSSPLNKNNPERRILISLQGGTSVSEIPDELWHEAHSLHKPVEDQTKKRWWKKSL